MESTAQTQVCAYQCPQKIIRHPREQLMFWGFLGLFKITVGPFSVFSEHDS